MVGVGHLEIDQLSGKVGQKSCSRSDRDVFDFHHLSHDGIARFRRTQVVTDSKQGLDDSMNGGLLVDLNPGVVPNEGVALEAQEGIQQGDQILAMQVAVHLQFHRRQLQSGGIVDEIEFHDLADVVDEIIQVQEVVGEFEFDDVVGAGRRDDDGKFY